MKQFAFVLTFIALFANFCFSQTETETVIVAIQKDRLTQQELIEFDSLKNSMYDLDEVHYFRKIYRHIDDLKKFYHLSCTANEDSIFNVLNRKTFFDTVFYDYPMQPCCDNPVYATDPLDTTYIQDLINLPCAWDITTGDTAIKIGIIDNHFYEDTHEDIINKVNQIYGPYYGDKRNEFQAPDPGDPTGISDHGLKMAGLISAEPNNNVGISGIAHNLMFDGFRFYEASDSEVHVSQIQNAVDEASFEYKAKILNISYPCVSLSEVSYTPPETDSTAFQNIVNNGTTIILSAGNERLFSDYFPNHRNVYDIPGVINVGAVNSDNKLLFSEPEELACNPYIEICAPGVGINTTSISLSQWGEWESDYDTNSCGTSPSAGMVSGVIGLMLSVDSTLTPPQIEHILKTSADSIADFDTVQDVVSGFWIEEFNAGRLNAYHAVYKAKHFNECTPSYIQADQNITWNDTTCCCDSLIVEGTLTIAGPVHLLTNLPHITIQNGGHLVFDTGSELYHWEDDNYTGNINVEAGSTLEFKNGSDIVLAENGKIMVNHDANNTGELIFNDGASLTLLDDNTNLEIAGDLHIASNATFTYSGDGYIKFSNPGGDATNNIFCGSGSSFVLQGSGQSDKIMEVQQSTVRLPAQLSNLEFRDGKIEMGNNKRMLAEVISGNEYHPITLDNIKITSDDGTNNAHRSFVFFGQPNVNIDNCSFENGKYGLDACNTYWGSSLSILNSDFINNQTGLHVYDKGVHLSYCEFTNNNTALDCEAMSFGSDLYRTNMFSNDYGVYYHGSSGADLDVDICEIQNNNYDGIRASGNFDMDVYCTYINNNRYGIYTQAGTDVHIENDAQNDFSDNDKTIYLDYGKIFANQGYNRLQSVNNDYAIYGLTDIGTRCGPTDLYANNNQWEDDPNVGPSYSDNYLLWLYGCFPMEPVTIIDNNPMVHFCSHYLVKGLNEDESSDTLTQEETEASALPLVSVSDDQSLPLDEAVYTLPVQLEQVQSAVDYQAMINTYIDIIETCDAYDNADVHYYKDIAWGHLHDVVDAYFTFVSHDTENTGFNQSLDDVMLLNETLMENPDVSRTSYYEYSLDNALLERLRENYNQSLGMLESLKFDIPEMDREIAYIDRWQCYIEAEWEAKLGNLSPDDFMAAIQDCRQTYNNTMETIHARDSLNDPGTEPGEDTTPSPNLTIIPNPNPGNFTIEVYCEAAAGDIKINNIYGQPVRTITLPGDGQQSVQVSGLAQGQYTVYYLQNGTVLDSENMIVE